MNNSINFLLYKEKYYKNIRKINTQKDPLTLDGNK